MKPIFEDDNLLVAYVLWNDAARCENCSGHDKDGDLDTDYVVMTVGYLFRETDTHVVLSTDWVDNNQEGRYMHYIPKGMIIEVWTIEAKHMRYNYDYHDPDRPSKTPSSPLSDFKCIT